MAESSYTRRASGSMTRCALTRNCQQALSVKTHMPMSFVYAMPQLVKLLKGYGNVMAYGFASEADDDNLLS